MVAVSMALLTKLASVAGHFFCETASALLSYFSQYILLIAYMSGVSVEGAVAQCDGASAAEGNRTTTTITILHQRTALEGRDEPSTYQHRVQSYSG
jgi:hypothetical protein